MTLWESNTKNEHNQQHTLSPVHLRPSCGVRFKRIACCSWMTLVMRWLQHIVMRPYSSEHILPDTYSQTAYGAFVARISTTHKYLHTARTCASETTVGARSSHQAHGWYAYMVSAAAQYTTAPTSHTARNTNKPFAHQTNGFEMSFDGVVSSVHV